MLSGSELAEWREKAKNTAVAADIPVLEVDWLLREVVGLDPLSLRLELYKTNPQISATISLEDLNQLWQVRLQERLPLQYLLGVTPWRNFRLQVSPAVLIPRPETEYLIDLVAEAVKANPNLDRGDWVDLGTGSGAIAIGLAELLPKARIHAVDLSEAALSIARINAANYGFADRITFYLGSWWQPLAFLRGRASGMVSNPPYIPSAEVPLLQPEVTRHEPHLALDGGKDGLMAIDHLISTASDYLIAGGFWSIELMLGQAETTARQLRKHGCYRDIRIHRDLAGIDRFVTACRSNSNP
jgi:release factor glutamine methyltransferase